MIKLTFCSIAYRDDPIESIIERLAHIGYDGVEVWAQHIEGKSDDELKAIRAFASEERIGLEVVSPYLWLTQTPELLAESFAIMDRTIAQARALGIPKIRTFTDSGPTGIGSDVATPEQRRTAVEALRKITAQAPEIYFVVETHPKTLADTPESMLQLLDEVGAENLKILYQPSSPETIVENYEKQKAHIRHIHLQNMDADGHHQFIEDGILDLPNFIARLKADGYDESISVEYCWKGATWDRAESAHACLAPLLK